MIDAQPVFAVLYAPDGTIIQRMSGGALTIAATAATMDLAVLLVPDDAAYEATHRVEDGALVEVQP